MFWALAGLMIVAVAAGLAWPLLGARTAAARRSAHDVAVYRDQLAEVERDLARGVVSAEDAAAIRTEVSRRLLAAADAEAGEDEAAPAPAAQSRGLALGVVAAIAVLGGGTYALIGQPGMPDRPLAQRMVEFQEERARRMGQAEAEAAILAERGPPDLSDADPEHLRLVEQLTGILADRPDDLQGHRLLAGNLAGMGRWAEAQAAQGQVLAILGDGATPADRLDRAEYMLRAAEGYISPEAEALIRASLEAAPEEPRGRFFSGLLLIQSGRPDLAYPIWERLLRDGPRGAPWVAFIEAEIDRLARAAGVDRPGALVRGPTADDLAAAAALSTEDREAMARGMVASLASRLADEGGPPEEWAQLIRALGVLGELASATEIWDEAQQVFADDAPALALLRRAARDAEIAQ